MNAQNKKNEAHKTERRTDDEFKTEDNKRRAEALKIYMMNSKQKRIKDELKTERKIMNSKQKIIKEEPKLIKLSDRMMNSKKKREEEMH